MFDDIKKRFSVKGWHEEKDPLTFNKKLEPVAPIHHDVATQNEIEQINPQNIIRPKAIEQQQINPDPIQRPPCAILTYEDYLYHINNNDWNGVNYVGEYLHKLFIEAYPNYEYILQMLRDVEHVDNKIINHARTRQEELWKEKELNFISIHPEWQFRIGKSGIEDNRNGMFAITNELQREAKSPATLIEVIYPPYLETLRLKIIAQSQGLPQITYNVQNKYSDNNIVPEQRTETSLLIPEESDLIKNFSPSLNEGIIVKDNRGKTYSVYFYQGKFYKGFEH